ncbi:MAG: WPE palindromic element domain-containing protein [Wolbachia endosymbiont of Polyergus mexicanus]|uniref:WPE palindromic element domain-containing protein n=1 Tax=Wolbachia endosymbiont of Polyergus mexicanus TaxID=3171167 RepID=A0AAU7YIR1_9RICK
MYNRNWIPASSAGMTR